MNNQTIDYAIERFKKLLIAFNEYEIIVEAWLLSMCKEKYDDRKEEEKKRNVALSPLLLILEKRFL